nr:hypothetical protein [Tanacetum cinerariifolium]
MYFQQLSKESISQSTITHHDYVYAFCLEIVEIHTINLIDKPTDDEFDNDNIIVDVKDYNNFIDDESTVDETTHDKYTHDEAINDDFDI